MERSAAVFRPPPDRLNRADQPEPLPGLSRRDAAGGHVGPWRTGRHPSGTCPSGTAPGPPPLRRRRRRPGARPRAGPGPGQHRERQAEPTRPLRWRRPHRPPAGPRTVASVGDRPDALARPPRQLHDEERRPRLRQPGRARDAERPLVRGRPTAATPRPRVHQHGPGAPARRLRPGAGRDRRHLPTVRQATGAGRPVPSRGSGPAGSDRAGRLRRYEARRRPAGRRRGRLPVQHRPARRATAGLAGRRRNLRHRQRPRRGHRQWHRPADDPTRQQLQRVPRRHALPARRSPLHRA